MKGFRKTFIDNNCNTVLFKLFCMTSNKIQNFNLKSNQNYKLGLSHCWMCVVVEHG